MDWQSDRLGIDGVDIEQVEDDTIFGKGTFDPPDVWNEFKLHLQTAKLSSRL